MRMARVVMLAVGLLSVPAVAAKPNDGKARTSAKKLDQKLRQNRKPNAGKQLKSDLKKVEAFLFGGDKK